jgi:hypothetical protein
MQIEVLGIRLLPPGRTLKAFVDVKVGDWIVREWRILKEDGRRLWVAPPQISWKAPDGQIQYKTLITLPDDVKGQVEIAILSRFTEEMENQDASTNK